MATAQQIQFAETIRAMKLALKRKADDSDSDTSIRAHTNRGNKLKRRAQTVRQGHLDTTGGSIYRKKVHHAGYLRNTISTNPPLYDQDGDPYSPFESDTEHNAAPLDQNAFGEVQLETLLRPLTSPAELADHPSLSLAYKSKALTELTKQAEEMVRTEKAKLWKAKRLLRRFLGDTEWVPCGAFEADHDELMLVGNEDAAEEGGQASAPSSVVDGGVPEIRREHMDRPGEPRTVCDSMEGVKVADMAAQQAVEIGDGSTANDTVPMKPSTGQAGTNGDSASAAEQIQTDDSAADANNEGIESASLQHPALADLRNSHDPEALNSEDTSTSGKDTAPSHSMTTRARAKSPAQSRTPSPSLSDSDTIPPVHPWYLIPLTSLPSRTMNLPTREADEARQLLLLYVQRQEHAVRLLTKLYLGLQRADELRLDIFRAAKADAHVGEMSDGEDWYDVEDWALGRQELKMGKDGVWGLEKGKDEVDDVNGGVGGGEEEGRRVGRGRRRAVRI